MNSSLRLLLLTILVGGGFTGFSSTAQLLLHPAASNLSYTLLTVLAISMWAFVFITGLIFASNSEKTQLLFAALALQIPCVSSSVLTYKFAADPVAFITFGLPENGGWFLPFFDGQLGVIWEFGATDGPWRIGTNVVAVIAIVLLWRAVHLEKARLKDAGEQSPRRGMKR